MRTSYILIALMIALQACSQSQKDNSGQSDFQLSFVAFMVTDIDTAISWYTDILGFNLLDRVDNAERGFSQANLQRDEMKIELIETNTTISMREVLINQSERARIAGFFKVGFTVQDFDQWIEHLSVSQVNFRGDIVVDQNTGKRMVVFLDPDGNRIQLFEHS
jgi:catechol 2,3-dioxygenase-like lactoylglutathione lyase family enzyme